jgi:hypothetical protein
VPKSSERLILFDSSLFPFLHTLAKIVVVCSKTSPSLPDKDDKIRMAVPNSCRLKFKELLTTYVLHGSPDRTEPWLLDEDLLPAFNNVVTTSELFLLAREVVHALFDHLNNDDFSRLSILEGRTVVEPLYKTLEEEREADFEGAKIAIVSFSDEPKAVSFAGIEIAIAARQLIDGTHSLFARKNPAVVYDNPRIHALHKALENRFGAKVRPYIEFGRAVCRIFDFLWRDIIPHLIELRDSRQTIAKVWLPRDFS